MSIFPVPQETALLIHVILEYAGLSVGAWLYRRSLRGQHSEGVMASGTFAVVVGLLMGAAIGNKAVFFIERPDVWRALLNGQAVWPGQSMVGGLLGGLIGVETAKWLTHQTRSTGDAMVLPLVVGMVIGRVGCFLAGLHDDTYGLPTSLPWGIDLGDGVPRHPSALYEIAFLVGLLWLLRRMAPHWMAVPGLQFKWFLFSYLWWRLLGDLLKPVRVPYPLGLSGIQWVCIVALLIYGAVLIRAMRQRPLSRPQHGAQPTEHVE